MNKRITGVVAAAALAVGLAGGIGACSSGPSGPPTASSVLQSNGYTQVSLQSLGQSADALTSTLPSGDVSSSAIGVKGDVYQFVIVTTPAGASDINSTGQLGSEESAASAVGVTITYSNDVLTLTGTPAQLSNLPSS
jgi:hypothetical protein